MPFSFVPYLPASLNVKNRILNGSFAIWQRGTSTTLANGAQTYQADRFYARNALGTNGIVTYSQVAAVLNNSAFGAKLQITTAPTAAQTNGCELVTVLENLDTVPLLGQSTSCGAQIKALGNVTQIGISLVYNTTEAKTITTLGAEQLFTVNSSTFTLASVLNQAVGTTPTAAGVVGIRIRITGVSTGNTYDLNNGFVVEQVQLVIGSTLPAFDRAGITQAQELAMCQRYFSQMTKWQWRFWDGVGASGYFVPIKFPQTMRAAPTMTIAGGTLSHVSSVTSANPTTDGFLFQINTAAAAGDSIIGNASPPDASWKADADI